MKAEAIVILTMYTATIPNTSCTHRGDDRQAVDLMWGDISNVLL